MILKSKADAVRSWKTALACVAALAMGVSVANAGPTPNTTVFSEGTVIDSGGPTNLSFHAYDDNSGAYPGGAGQGYDWMYGSVHVNMTPGYNPVIEVTTKITNWDIHDDAWTGTFISTGMIGTNFWAGSSAPTISGNPYTDGAQFAFSDPSSWDDNHGYGDLAHEWGNGANIGIIPSDQATSASGQTVGIEDFHGKATTTDWPGYETTEFPTGGTVMFRQIIDNYGAGNEPGGSGSFTIYDGTTLYKQGRAYGYMSLDGGTTWTSIGDYEFGIIGGQNKEADRQGNDYWDDVVYQAMGFNSDSTTAMGVTVAYQVNKLYNGDANGDGKVDLLDLAALAGNWGAVSVSGVQWTGGDFNQDGNVDLLDLSLLAGNWGASMTVDPSAAPAVVPEPATLALLTLGAGCMFLRRRRNA